ncbi:MAG: hypothetical protein ACKV2V_04310 [Blastocatellia bacterium]
MKDNTVNKIAIGILLIGLMQMTGDVAGSAALKANGAATTMSPAPKVFTAMRGYEAYSTRFYLEWTDGAGRLQSRLLTPELYERVTGPYNRRNVYGAVLAGGPILATDARLRPMFDSVSRYALCGNAALLRDLGLDPADVAGSVRVRYEPLPGTQLHGLPGELEVVCR